ncbi:MAG TPA: hypothetical protein VH107_16230 [Lacipirellulaceae bacterium]|nr:hypothetical protein [Lacipirellulaceae bacterium]
MHQRRGPIFVLRWVATAALVVGSIVGAVSWCRNFWRADVVWAPLPFGGYVVLASQNGQLEIATYLPTSSTRSAWPTKAAPWAFQSYAATGGNLFDVLLPRAKPVRFRRLPNSYATNLIAPFWFLIPLCWLLAAGLWTRWSLRFSLRAMMIATSIVALVMAVYVSSKW